MQDSFEVWKGDLALIWKQVVHLSHLDDVFWQVGAIISKADAFKRTSVFPDWMACCFVDALAAGLRRLVDTTPHTISLSRVLHEMENKAAVFTRARYLSLFDEHPSPVLRNHAEEFFDLVAGKSARWIPEDRFKEQRLRLVRICDPIINYANTYVTHLSDTVRPSAEGVPEMPTFNDVRRALLAIYSAFRWCSLALTGDDHLGPVPTIQENWLACFHESWIPSGSATPAYQTLMNFGDDGSLGKERTA